MATSAKNDQVFQLSLTEIAFTLVFILLLLLGFLIVTEQTARETAESALAKSQRIETSTEQLESARMALAEALAGAGAKKENLDETITRLSEAQEARADRDRLANQVEDLDARISAMTELEKVIQSSARGREAALDEVVSALALQNEIRKTLASSQDTASVIVDKTSRTKASQDEGALEAVREAMATSKLLKMNLKAQLDLTLAKGRESETIRDVVAAARAQAESAKGGGGIEATRKENSDLRGQVAFFKRRLEARGGRDYPPCWATEAGSPEFLFSIELTPAGVMVQPAWPSRRESDARSLPAIDSALQSSVSLEVFVRNIQGIFSSSRAADPQCRHYVFLKSSIAEAVASDRARLTVENYFYKSEARR